jgi:hypothetical protein
LDGLLFWFGLEFPVVLACCSRCLVQYLYILRCLDQPQTSVPITHHVFSSPNPPSSHSSATSTSKASRHQGKNERGGHGGQSIDRLITAGWGIPLLKTRRPRHISSHHVIRPHASLELVRKKKLGTSGLRLQLSDRNVETKKTGPSPHTQVLYIPCAVHDHACDLSGQGGTLAARKKINTHAQGRSLWFYSF